MQWKKKSYFNTLNWINEVVDKIFSIINARFSWPDVMLYYIFQCPAIPIHQSFYLMVLIADYSTKLICKGINADL